jgi:signal transduction histidine kinase
VTVHVSHHDDALHLEISDDGRGGANPDGPGLRGLRDRVEAAGGVVRLESVPQQGTSLQAVIPCES